MKCYLIDIYENIVHELLLMNDENLWILYEDPQVMEPKALFYRYTW